MRLKQIEKKLVELSDKFAEVYPKFIQAEEAYQLKMAQIMMSQSILGLVSQPLRDAEAKRLMSTSNEYIEYMKVMPEYKVIDTQIRIWRTIAQISTWGEVSNNG